MSTKEEQPASGSSTGTPDLDSPSTSEMEIAIDLDDPDIATAIDGAQSDNEGPENPKNLGTTTPPETASKSKKDKKDKNIKINMPLSPLELERSLSATAAVAVTTPVAVLRQLSASPRTAKAVEKVQSHKTAESICIVLIFLTMTVSCFYIGIQHNDDDSACSKLDFVMGLTPSWFLYVASTESSHSFTIQTP